MEPNILFCTPCYSSMVTAAYCQSSLELRATLTRRGIRHAWAFRQGSLITWVRNELTADFILGDYTHLFWIDADIEFKPDDVLKLLKLKADIAVATYRMKRPNGGYTACKDDAPITDLNRFEGPTEIDYCGCGFMCIRRGVIDRLAQHAGVYRGGITGTTGRWLYALFQSTAFDGSFPGEDVYLCLRAREAGFKIIMDPSVRLGHVGQFVYGDQPLSITEAP